MVDAGSLKHELLNRLWLIKAANVLIEIFKKSIIISKDTVFSLS
jgi:hypothetical protein